MHLKRDPHALSVNEFQKTKMLQKILFYQESVCLGSIKNDMNYMQIVHRGELE